ncbi:uncharacterized protein [Chelonus insularis]|uniref:uncharacterized protein n=1 Tax=Chelonus insularis TaxID=460826 RepID=UPI00158896A2|nr:uncharacterized protein LOC118067342 [Chelonus insularis]
MAHLSALLMITLACIIVNVQGQQPVNKKLLIGQAFDEIVVSSDLNVRRKSKENRQGKGILTNVPSGTTGPPGRYTSGTALRLISSDGSQISPETRQRRQISRKESIDLGIAGYLLKSRRR